MRGINAPGPELLERLKYYCPRFQFQADYRKLTRAAENWRPRTPSRSVKSCLWVSSFGLGKFVLNWKDTEESLA